MRQTFAVMVVVWLAACGRTSDRADTAAGGMDTGGMAGTAGMGTGGMGGMMSGAMMDSMVAHMREMDTANAANVQAMLPVHRQLAGNMIAQMNREMGDMKMPTDAGWTALMDSVRQDLIRMPDMDAQQLKAFMPGHQHRMTRLIDGHRSMMRDMKM